MIQTFCSLPPPRALRVLALRVLALRVLTLRVLARQAPPPGTTTSMGTTTSTDTAPRAKFCPGLEGAHLSNYVITIM
ncbi:hypothetical protein BDZ88DRAFT_424846 [Geranomyces variabilis]|nr:hypothetical protein BDZ88DRAFT_424846 [Geranomyces variabilis]